MYQYDLHQKVNKLLQTSLIDIAGEDNLFYTRMVANMAAIHALYMELYAHHQNSNAMFDELLQTISGKAAEIWGLNKGSIRQGYLADIVVARKNDHTDSMEAFYATDPKDLLLVIRNGKIQLFDADVCGQVDPFLRKNYGKININGDDKYVAGDLEKLCNQIRQFYPEMKFPFGVPN